MVERNYRGSVAPRQHHYATLKGAAQVSHWRSRGFATVRRVSVASPFRSVAQFPYLLAHYGEIAHVAAGVQPLHVAEVALDDHVIE